MFVNRVCVQTVLPEIINKIFNIIFNIISSASDHKNKAT